MRYASVCDGIGAAHAAWIPLGWQCAWVSEIEPFPIAVVEERVPGLVNLGDMNAITQEMLNAHGRIDALVGGTPCQSFSVAGLRGGLADARGNLALRFVQLVGALRPAWVVWENVPGVLSSNGGRDFGAILGALDELGYGWAYRVLDAQHFGVPQRRRRVFVVASSRDWRRAAAVLFEREGMRGNPPTRRATGACVARSLTSSTGGASAKEQQHTFVGGDGKPLNALRASWWDGSQLRPTIDARIDQHRMPDKGRFSAVLEPAAFKASHYTRGKDGAPSHVTPPLCAGSGKGDQDTLVAHTSDGVVADPITTAEGKAWTNEGNTFRLRNCVQQAVGTDVYNGAITGDVAATMGTPGSSVNASGPTVMEAVGFVPKAPPGSRSMGERVEQSPTVTTHQLGQGVATHMAVRRLTPLECERLQGFPDGWTQIPWRKKPAEECPDGPRYRALGNSMAVPVMRWIGERIAAVEAIR